jgi:A/G-specific adenine glycosylase
MDVFSPLIRSRFQRRLLGWFRRHQRSLPWRRSRDPYRIWVSEIMLQQTQVATVKPYFERFLKRFPALADLAAADEQEVLRLWEGLGYYRRARHLHRAARTIVSEFDGKFPTRVEIVRTLPGVGRYTAAAILSQALDQRLPIIEANSRRVLCRLLGVRDDPRRGATQRFLWQAAEALLPSRQVGMFNQALMELGALVCTPGQPRCASCPVASMCVAHRDGLQDQIPLRARPPTPIDIQEAAVVVRKHGRVLLVQRADEGRWAGMWEFPHAPLEAPESHKQAATRLVPALTGIRAEIGAELLRIRHGVTHHRITLVCFEATYRTGKFQSGFYHKGRWLSLAQLTSYPVSAPQRRLAQALQQQGGGPTTGR